MQTRQEVIDYLKRRLGAPTVNIELTVDQWQDSVDDALRMYNRYMFTAVPNLARSEIINDQASNTGTVILQLDDDVTGVLYVNILRPREWRATLQLNVFELMYRMAMPIMSPGEWYMKKMFIEMYRKVQGTEPDWKFDETTRRLYVDCIAGPFDIFYVTAQNLSIDKFLSTGIKGRNLEEFLRLALCYAKERISYVRGKFTTIPVPGGSLAVDADRMGSEARADMEKLELQLKRRANARLLPQWG